MTPREFPWTPCNDFVLISERDDVGRAGSVIEMPDGIDEEVLFGEVIAVGPGAHVIDKAHNKPCVVPMRIKVGMIVGLLAREFAYQKADVTISGESYFLVRENQVALILTGDG